MHQPLKKKNQQTEPFELTEVEWTIIKVVWENQPCAAGTVQEALAQEKGWAYSTVKTTMDRMVGKGLLEIKKIRNLQLFSSSITKANARKGEFQKMLSRAFDGALGPMMQYLVEHEKLSDDDIEQLRKLVNSQKEAKS